MTKAAVLYHFREKTDILAALSKPMLDALDATLAAADLADPAETRWAVLEGLLEVWLAHRYLMRMNLQDLAMASNASFFRFRDATLRANEMVAGPRASFAERVRASQAIAMLADPVVLFADSETDALRTHVLRNVRRLFDAGELRIRAGTPPATREVPARRRGRKRLVDERMARTAQKLHDSGASVDEIASKIGVSRATVYRHLRRG